MDYAEAGVNIDFGDDVSKIFYNAARETWKNREGKLGELIVPFDDFSGVRAIDVSGLPQGTLMNMGFDGVGTKMEIAERVGDHRTIAYDLFAMVCDDAVVRGAEPVLIGSIFDVRTLGKGDENYLEQVKQLAEGYVGAAKAANVAIVNGEVAELGDRVGGFGSFNYNWGAAVVWFANSDRLFKGKEIKIGDYLVGLGETGFRSNGLSLARKILREAYGNNWHKIKLGGLESLGRAVLKPSTIYSAAVVDMFGGYNGEARAHVSGVSHITGGGIPGKLGRMLRPSGFGAMIDNPLEPGEIVSYCQLKGQVPDREAYRTWNMGQGMIIATREPNKVIEVAEEHGLVSKIIGEIVSGPSVKIRSRGVYGRGDVLEFGLN